MKVETTVRDVFRPIRISLEIETAGELRITLDVLESMVGSTAVPRNAIHTIESIRAQLKLKAD